MSKANERSIDPVSQQMLDVAEKGGHSTAWDRWEAMQPQCGFGSLGICCRICNMGPCRIDPFGEGPQARRLRGGRRHHRRAQPGADDRRRGGGPLRPRPRRRPYRS